MCKHQYRLVYSGTIVYGFICKNCDHRCVIDKPHFWMAPPKSLMDVYKEAIAKLRAYQYGT